MGATHDRIGTPVGPAIVDANAKNSRHPKSVNENTYTTIGMREKLKNKSGVGRRVVRKRAWAEMCAAMIAVGCYIDIGSSPAGGGGHPARQDGPPTGGASGVGEDADQEEDGRKRRRVEVHVSNSTVGQQLRAAKGDLRKLWGAPDADG